MRKTLLIIGMVVLTAAISKISMGGKSPPENNDTINEWDIFIEALIFVESSGNPKAIGKNNDLGLLQITPIYVEDVNRILGVERYSHIDALDSLKSLEMLEVIQSHYNPQKCLKTAISHHNPKAGKWYQERIFSKMDELKLENYGKH